MPFEERGLSPEERLRMHTHQFWQAGTQAASLVLQQLRQRLAKAHGEVDQLTHDARRSQRESAWPGPEYAKDAARRSELTLLIGDITAAIESP